MVFTTSHHLLPPFFLVQHYMGGKGLKLKQGIGSNHFQRQLDETDPHSVAHMPSRPSLAISPMHACLWNAVTRPKKAPADLLLWTSLYSCINLAHMSPG